MEHHNFFLVAIIVTAVPELKAIFKDLNNRTTQFFLFFILISIHIKITLKMKQLNKLIDIPS